MIAIKALGGVKRALDGRSELYFDKPSCTVGEILSFLQNQSSEPRLLQPTNLIIAINGVDSSALQGYETLAKSGDTITVVTVVHGGSMFLIEGEHVAVLGIKEFGTSDSGRALEQIRIANPQVAVQALDANWAYGLEHLSAVIRIVLESKHRRIMIANRAETELLLRLARTNQISEAISEAGIKSGQPACLIGFSEEPDNLKNFITFVSSRYHVDNSIILQNAHKAIFLAERLGLPSSAADTLIPHLIEQAAILEK